MSCFFQAQRVEKGHGEEDGVILLERGDVHATKGPLVLSHLMGEPCRLA
jgi:hypothetical protein